MKFLIEAVKPEIVNGAEQYIVFLQGKVPKDWLGRLLGASELHTVDIGLRKQEEEPAPTPQVEDEDVNGPYE